MPGHEHLGNSGAWLAHVPVLQPSFRRSSQVPGHLGHSLASPRCWRFESADLVREVGTVGDHHGDRHVQLTALTVIVVDDHTVVRRGIIAFLEVLPDITAAGEAANGAEALELLDRLAREDALPDVALVDIKMPGMDGAQTITQLRTRFPAVRAVILTGYTEIEYAHAALAAGAGGYVLKDASPDQVAQAIRCAAHGDMYLDPSVAGGLASRMFVPTGLAALTDQERNVLALVAQGLTNREIGTRLHISERTVRSHMSAVLAKLGLTSRTQAALFAVREGLVRPNEH
jgi:DNA-binding NarL/FixJ family response regulator